MNDGSPFLSIETTRLLIKIAIAGLSRGMPEPVQTILQGLDAGRPGFSMTAPIRAFNVVVNIDKEEGMRMFEDLIMQHPGNMLAKSILACYLDADKNPRSIYLADEVLASNADPALKEMLHWRHQPDAPPVSDAGHSGHAAVRHRATFAG
ncbi:MAG: HrpB1 family type III secretion system apparatus protein [Burkholderiaceae bacterium]